VPKKKEPPSRALIPEIIPPRKELAFTQPAAEALSGFLSGNTKRAYERDLKDFFEVENLEMIPMARITSITPRDVVAFRDKLLADKKKPSTVQRKLSAIRSLYNYLMAAGGVTINPAHPKLVRAPKKSSVQKTDIVSWDDAVKMLKGVDRSTRLGRRDYLLILLGFNLGTRCSELLGAQLEDIKHGPEGWYVHVRGKGEKDRFIFLRPDIKEALDVYLLDRGDAPGPLFPGRKAELDGSRYWRIVKFYAEKVGLKGIHPHSLRAAFITLAHQQGVPVGNIQKTVGHARGETTLGYVRDLEMIKSSATKALKGLSAD